MSSQSSLTGIPAVLKLTDQNNYHTWKGTSKIILTYIGCWDLVSGVTQRPSSEPLTSDTVYTINNSLSKWDRISNKALSFLVMNIDQSLIPLISSCNNAAQAWTILADKFDRKNAVSLHSLIKAITTLTYDEKSSLSDHLSNFDNLWTRLKERTSSATSEERLDFVLKGLADSDEAKGTFLLLSLPKTYDNIVDNLQTKENLTYNDVYQRLINLASASNQDQDNSAYQVKTNRILKEYFWYHKQGFNYKNHL